MSRSLLLSCPSKQGCGEQAATTAAKSFRLRLATSPPLDSLGTGRRAGCKLNKLFWQWQLLPAAILPRGHLPVTSQTCNPHVMGEQPSSHQERLRPGGSCSCCQNSSSDTQPVPSALQSCTQGSRLLGTGCGPDKLSCLPQKPALCRMSTCFLTAYSHRVPKLLVVLIIRLLFVHFPSVHIWSTKEGPGLIASGSRETQETGIPTFPWPSVHSCLTLGKPPTPSSSEVFGCLPPTELSKNEKPVPCQEKADVSIPYLPGPFLAYRN